LLFLCAGEIEHTVGSRDIEDMSGLVHKAPMLAIITAFGIVSMILPPFGVLVTKWISIEVASQNPIIAILLVLGSAFTTIFWLKWISTILGYETDKREVHSKMDYTISIPLQILSVMILLTTIFITPIFNFFVSPEVTQLLGGENALTISKGKILSELGSFNEIMLFIIIIVTVGLYFLIKMFSSTAKVTNVYMCGENNTKDDKFSFRHSNGVSEKAVVSNLYLYETLNEKIIIKVGYVISITLIVLTLLGGLR
jgi:ech hydrogenase subunit A